MITIKKQGRWRVSKAAKFGKIEHKYGRLQFIPNLLAIVFSVWLFIRGKETIFLILLILNTLTFLFQSIYIISHTIEKKLYGHFGPRG